MSRSGYSEYCENVALWRGAVHRAMTGYRGQHLLRKLRDALDAMPVKRLITDKIADDHGGVCAFGAIDPRATVDPCDRVAVGKHFGIAPAMAAEIVYMNDEGLGWYSHETPEERWVRMRAWVDEQIVSVPAGSEAEGA